MKWMITSRTLTAAMINIAAVAIMDVDAPLFNHQVLAQVASIKIPHTNVAGLNQSALGCSINHLIRYNRGNNTIHSRSTICQ